jgi:hypothetical protein
MMWQARMSLAGALNLMSNHSSCEKIIVCAWPGAGGSNIKLVAREAQLACNSVSVFKQPSLVSNPSQ